MIKCENNNVIIEGEWHQILTEYLNLSEKIIQMSDKKYGGELNPTIPHLMKTFEKKLPMKIYFFAWIIPKDVQAVKDMN